jgi:hypothetical protein
MRLEQIAIASVIFALFITLGLGLYAEQVNNYGLPSDGIVMGETFKQESGANDIAKNIETTNSIITDAQVSTDNSDSAVAKAATPAGKTITNYKTDTGKEIQAVTKVFKLPSIVTDAFTWIIAILCAAYIIYLFRGFAPPKD